MSKHTHTHIYFRMKIVNNMFFILFFERFGRIQYTNYFFLFVGFLKIKNNPESLKGFFLNTS